MSLPFVPVANTVYASLRFTQPDGSTASNGYWIKKGSVWTPTEMLALAGVLKTWWINGDGTQKPQGFVTEDYALAEITVRDYTTQNSAAVTYNTLLPLAGTHMAVDAMPMGTSFALTQRTGLAGRSYRGRTFLIGLSTTLMAVEERNTMSGTAISEIITAYNALIPAIVAGDAGQALVVASRYWNAGVKGGPMLSRVAGITTDVLSFGNSNLLMDFQRSRAPGH